MKSRVRKSSSPVTCIEVDGVQHNQTKSIAEILNNHFCSIGSTLVAKLKSGVAHFSRQNQQDNVSSNHDIDAFEFHPVDELFVKKSIM